MKRGILLILAFLLLLDLTDDGFLDKAKFVRPYSSAQISLNSNPCCHSGSDDTRYTLPSLNSQEVFNLSQFQLVILRARPVLTIITLCNNGSSGAIPL
jgi:hypothetical protein